MKKSKIIMLLSLFLVLPIRAKAFVFNRIEDTSAKDLVKIVLSKGIETTNEVKKGTIYSFSGGAEYFGMDSGIILDTSGQYDDYYIDEDLKKIVDSSKNTLVEAYNKLSKDEKDSLGFEEEAPSPQMCYDYCESNKECLNECLSFVEEYEGGEALASILTAKYDEYSGGHTSSLEFEMTATGSLLNFDYAFLSGEFTELPEYNDLFGLFVSVNDGPYENIALVTKNDKSVVPVNISTLRGGLSGTEMLNGLDTDLYSYGSHSLFKVFGDEESEEEEICLDDENGCIYFNGVSNVFNAQKEVKKGDKVKVKFVIADASDTFVDSYVAIRAESLSFDPKYNTSYDGSDNGFIKIVEKSLNKAIPLTDEEQVLVGEGEDINVRLVVKNANETISDNDKKLIEQAAGDNKIAFYFDASLFKKIGSLDEVKLNVLSKKIKLYYEVEDEYINKDLSKERIYKVVRVHDGKAEIIDGEYDPEANIVTFETDRFSSYALIYEDRDINGKKNINNPETADMIMTYVTVGVMAVVALFGIKYLNKKEN